MAQRMTRARTSRHALVMAFDEAFAVGAETALFSVLRHNPWFDARVIVFGQGLSTRTCAALSRLYPVEFVALSPEVESIARRVGRSSGYGSNESPRFYALQLFSLKDLDRAVFLDVDTLCTGDVSALFSESSDFAAAPDHVQLKREVEKAAGRHERTSGTEPYGRALAYSWNSGVMTVSARWLTPAVYQDLLQVPGIPDAPGFHRLADQYVLNRYFEGNVEPLSPCYNFLVSMEALLRGQFGLTLPDARILHFAGCPKPWGWSWEQARERAPVRFLRYYECWYETREQLTGELSREGAVEQQRLGLQELSLAARARK